MRDKQNELVTKDDLNDLESLFNSEDQKNTDLKEFKTNDSVKVMSRFN